MSDLLKKVAAHIRHLQAKTHRDGRGRMEGRGRRAEDPHTNANTDMERGPIEKVWEAKKEKGKKDRQKVGHDNARIENNK